MPLFIYKTQRGLLVPIVNQAVTFSSINLMSLIESHECFSILWWFPFKSQPYGSICGELRFCKEII